MSDGDLPVSQGGAVCFTDVFSSRRCEKGTSGCVISHATEVDLRAQLATAHAALRLAQEALAGFALLATEGLLHGAKPELVAALDALAAIEAALK